MKRGSRPKNTTIQHARAFRKIRRKRNCVGIRSWLESRAMKQPAISADERDASVRSAGNEILHQLLVENERSDLQKGCK